MTTPLIDLVLAELTYHGGWHLVSDDPASGIRRFICVENVNGQFQVMVKTETYAMGAVLGANARDRSETAGQRWGDFRRYGSVPVDIWNRELDEAHRNGDEKYVAKWFNDPDHAAFRTFEGTV